MARRLAMLSFSVDLMRFRAWNESDMHVLSQCLMWRRSLPLLLPRISASVKSTCRSCHYSVVVLMREELKRAAHEIVVDTIDEQDDPECDEDHELNEQVQV